MNNHLRYEKYEFTKPIEEYMSEAIGNVLNEQGVISKMFSYKSCTCMFVASTSWVIAGRILWIRPKW